MGCDINTIRILLPLTSPNSPTDLKERFVVLSRCELTQMMVVHALGSLLDTLRAVLKTVTVVAALIRM